MLGLIAAVAVTVGSPMGAQAGESPAGAPATAAPQAGMSDTLKKAAGHGTNTAVDEAVRGTSVGDATKKGRAAAVNHALGVPGAAAAPQEAPAAE